LGAGKKDTGEGRRNDETIGGGGLTFLPIYEELIHRGFELEYLLYRATLKQVLLLYNASRANQKEENKEKAVLEFLITAGAFGSKVAIRELKKILGYEKDEIEYI